jgi:2-amino-4-hydroxy-6-hydroxymethyldihydropteridine diphosphokinase
MSSDCTEPSDRGPIVFIALGSNLGNSAALIKEAMDRLDALSAKPARRSSLWRTSPVDCPPGSGDFVNAVVQIIPRPGETPETLLEKLQSLEKEFGRKPKIVLNEARPLDLDIIAFGQETRRGERLILPHPRAHLRRFVLAPLAEIAPDLVLSGQNQTVRGLLSALPAGSENVERFH